MGRTSVSPILPVVQEDLGENVVHAGKLPRHVGEVVDVVKRHHLGAVEPKDGVVRAVIRRVPGEGLELRIVAHHLGPGVIIAEHQVPGHTTVDRDLEGVVVGDIAIREVRKELISFSIV